MFAAKTYTLFFASLFSYSFLSFFFAVSAQNSYVSAFISLLLLALIVLAFFPVMAFSLQGALASSFWRGAMHCQPLTWNLLWMLVLCIAVVSHPGTFNARFFVAYFIGPFSFVVSYLLIDSREKFRNFIRAAFYVLLFFVITVLLIYFYGQEDFLEGIGFVDFLMQNKDVDGVEDFGNYVRYLPNGGMIYRAAGLFLAPTTVGFALVAYAGVGVGLYPDRKPLLFAHLAIGIFGALISTQRTALLGFVVFAFLLFKKMDKKVLFLCLGINLVVFSLLYYDFSLLFQFFPDVDGSAIVHFQHIVSAPELIMDNPIGYGLGIARGLAGPIHGIESFWLTVAVEAGVHGVVICFMAMWSACAMLPRAGSSDMLEKEDAWLFRCVVAVAVALMLMGLFLPSLGEIHFVMLLFGILGGAVRVVYEAAKK